MADGVRVEPGRARPVVDTDTECWVPTRPIGGQGLVRGRDPVGMTDDDPRRQRDRSAEPPPHRPAMVRQTGRHRRRPLPGHTAGGAGSTCRPLRRGPPRGWWRPGAVTIDGIEAPGRAVTGASTETFSVGTATGGLVRIGTKPGSFGRARPFTRPGTPVVQPRRRHGGNGRGERHVSHDNQLGLD
jgi:hypothetical protein